MRGQAGQVAPELIRVLALVSGATHFDLIKKRAIRCRNLSCVPRLKS